MDNTKHWKVSGMSNDGLCGCVEECYRTVFGCESFERKERYVMGKLGVVMK